jgi:hypothetical protein
VDVEQELDVQLLQGKKATKRSQLQQEIFEPGSGFGAGDGISGNESGPEMLGKGSGPAEEKMNQVMDAEAFCKLHGDPKNASNQICRFHTADVDMIKDLCSAMGVKEAAIHLCTGLNFTDFVCEHAGDSAVQALGSCDNVNEDTLPQVCGMLEHLETAVTCEEWSLHAYGDPATVGARLDPSLHSGISGNESGPEAVTSAP